MHGASHAGYYPGAVMMDIKINFSPENGKLLGAQAVGVDGVDKRLEMMSAVIRNGGTIYDLWNWTGFMHPLTRPRKTR